MIDDRISKAKYRKKIAEVALVIRKKVAALKSGRSEYDETLQNVFQPIAKPLHELASKITLPTVKPTLPIKRAVKVGSIKPEVKVERGQQTDPEFLPLKDIGSLDMTKDDDTFYESEDDPKRFSDADVSEEAIENYMEQYPEISHEFILNYWNENDKIDKIYGPKYDPNISKWYLGGKELNFDNNFIVVDKLKFPASKGLYGLIFYSDCKFTQGDLDQYKKILELSKVHKDSINRLKGSKTHKYNEIIRPLFIKSGSGLDDSLIYNDKPIEYVYWDDINEIVDRLRLLYSSKQAGNTSHDNEIAAIINELKEAGVIV